MDSSGQKAAYVLVTCHKESHENLIKKFKKIKEIDTIQRTLGVYDMVIRILGGSEDQIKHQIRNQICNNPEVGVTLTLICKEKIRYQERIERLDAEISHEDNFLVSSA